MVPIFGRITQFIVFVGVGFDDGVNFAVNFLEHIHADHHADDLEERLQDAARQCTVFKVTSFATFQKVFKTADQKAAEWIVAHSGLFAGLERFHVAFKHGPCPVKQVFLIAKAVDGF